MPCESKVDHKRELVHSTLSGKAEIDVLKQFTTDAARLADRHGYTRLLFDIRRLKTRPTTVQIFDLATAAEKRGLTRQHRRATVYAGEEQGRDLRFFQDVSVNRGYDVASFTDIGPAIEWLTAG